MHINKTADVVIRLDDTNDDYSIADVCSVSSNNRIDGGFNAQTIKSFITSLKRTLVNRYILDHY